MADVLAGDLQRHTTRHVPADDVVAEVMDAQRAKAVQARKPCTFPDASPGLPDGREAWARSEYLEASDASSPAKLQLQLSQTVADLEAAQSRSRELLERATTAHHPRQTLGAAAAEQDPDRHLHLIDDGLAERAIAHVACHRDLASATPHTTGDLADRDRVVVFLRDMQAPSEGVHMS